MKLPLQSPPVVRYTTSNLIISPQSGADSSEMTTTLRNTTTFSSGISNAGKVTSSASCIGVGIVNRRVCLSLPVVGRICIPVLSVPLGNVGAQACISVCKHGPFGGIPTGACASIKVGGVQVARQCFGWC